MKTRKITLVMSLVLLALASVAQNNIAEEVAWVIGDTPIWKSEIEEEYNNALYENVKFEGDPYCLIPEQLAIQKLFLHQAEIDTIEANESAVISEVDSRLNFYIMQLGSKEKVEQYFHRSMPDMRTALMDMVRNQSIIEQVQRNLTENIKVTPSDIRKYFNRLSEDSIPYVPLQVEVQIIKLNPLIPRQEIEDVKARLRGFSEAVTNGESEFSTLAILYSEDGTATRGGETGFLSKADLDPEYAAVAFNLNDPKKVSKIVESQYGFHVIQLIEKRGDRINTRHILLRPKVSQNELNQSLQRLDSLRSDMMAGKFTFEESTQFLSQDKDTRNNRGVMVNKDGTPRFQMSELPQEISKVVDKMQPGDISDAFVMIDPKLNREVVAIVKLTNRIEGHKANLSDDFEQIKGMYESDQRQAIINKWLDDKIKNTYVRIEDGWRNCEFRHSGWIKERSGDAK